MLQKCCTAGLAAGCHTLVSRTACQLQAATSLNFNRYPTCPTDFVVLCCAAWFWWTSRKQRDDKKVKGSVPQKVGCIYDFGVAPMSMSSIQLSSKSAQH
jgi:hypothetical protein